MRRQILLVNIVSLLIGISYGMHNPILPIFASETIGATYSEIGAIGVANFAPYIFVHCLLGYYLTGLTADGFLPQEPLPYGSNGCKYHVWCRPTVHVRYSTGNYRSKNPTDPENGFVRSDERA